MLIAGSLLALFTGLANAAAAAIEKREGIVAGEGLRAFALVATLVRRPWWLVAMGLSVAAWVTQAASLALAPITAVAPLMAAGRALLVGLGIRWFAERFGAMELGSVVLATVGGGVAAVASTGSGEVVHTELSNLTQIEIGIVALVLAVVLTRRKAGVTYGIGAGILFAATGVYTKEIGDRFALHGLGAVQLVLASPSLWVMLLFGAIAQSFLQTAFQEANAASVSAANAAIASNGLVIAGFVLYKQPFPAGLDGALLVIGLLLSALGATLLAARSRNGPPSVRADPEPSHQPK